jgi:hypothetical protein
MLIVRADCLRDIGVDEECYAVGTKGDSMVHTRWSNSMAGEEYARIYSWGNDPKRKVSNNEGDGCIGEF